MFLQLSLLAVIAGQVLMLLLVARLQKQISKCEEQCRYLGYLYCGLEYEARKPCASDPAVADS